MYSFAAYPNHGFGRDIIFDQFNGTGATCVAAKAANRRFIGIDIHESYFQFARNRLEPRRDQRPEVMVKRPRMKSVTAQEPEALLFTEQ